MGHFALLFIGSLNTFFGLWSAMKFVKAASEIDNLFYGVLFIFSISGILSTIYALAKKAVKDYNEKTI